MKCLGAVALESLHNSRIRRKDEFVRFLGSHVQLIEELLLTHLSAVLQKFLLLIVHYSLQVQVSHTNERLTAQGTGFSSLYDSYCTTGYVSWDFSFLSLHAGSTG